MIIRRRRVVWLVVLVALVAVTGGALAALPRIVRRVAVSRITTLTGRAVTLEDVAINLFTGRVVLTHFRLAQRGSSEPALALDRLDVAVSYLSLLWSHARVTELIVTAPEIHVARTGSGTFDFSDLLALIPPPDPSKPPSKWTIGLDRLSVRDGAIVALDQVTTPASSWRIDGLTVEGVGLTTRAGAGPGRLRLAMRVNGATVGFDASAVDLHGGTVTAKAAIERFGLPMASRYVPAAVVALPRAGTLTLALSAKLERGKDGAPRGAVSGEVKLDGLELVRRDASDPFLTVAHLAVAIKGADVATQTVTLGGVDVDGLVVKASRNREGTIDLATLVARDAAPPAESSPAPGGSRAPPGSDGAPTTAAVQSQAPRAVFTVERLAVARSAVLFRDLAVSPTTEWRIDDLSVDGGGLTTATGAAPGRLAVAAKLNGSKLSLTDGAVVLEPVSLAARLGLEGFDLASVRPYVPPDLPASPSAGRASLALDIALEPGPPMKGSVAGDVKLETLALVARDRPDAFAKLARASVKIRRADLATLAVTLASVDLDGLALAAGRDAQGNIDLLQMLAAKAPAPTTPTPAARPSAADASAGQRTVATPGRKPPETDSTPAVTTAPAALALTLDRVQLKRGTFTFKDEAVLPLTTLALSDVTASFRDVTWPSKGPAGLEVAMGLPAGGRLEIKGTATPQPFDADFSMSIRGAPVEPYAPYHPFRAVVGGTFNGDSRSQVKIVNGALMVTSRGDSWGDAITVRDPDAPPGTTPPIQIERMAVSGIEFVWPTSARAERVTVTRPALHVEREKDGSLPLRQLFAFRPVGPAPGATASTSPAPAMDQPSPPRSAQATTAAVPATSAAAAAPASANSAAPDKPLLPLAVDIGAIVIEDGFARFVDRTIEPAFSESLSRLAVSVEGLSSNPGRRAKLTLQSIVGGDAALHANGEIAPLGQFYADIVAELRDFSLASVSPYSDSFVSWIVERGKLGARIRYHIEGGELTANNEVIVGNLEVARSRASADKAQQRLGLPLGLIVALVKDGHGDIKLNVPISGMLSDPTFDLGDAIWTAIKNVIVNIAAAPFRAIGRLFTGQDNTIEAVKVEPITFLPGNSVVSASMERHLIRVADFLRGAPAIKLALAPVGTEADAKSLRSQEVTARLQTLQREKALAEYSAAVAVEFRARFPDGKPLPSSDEQIARLVEAEPVPEARVAELLTRRLEAVRDALVKTEHIDAARLLPPPEGKTVTDAKGEGRVEFHVSD